MKRNKKNLALIFCVCILMLCFFSVIYNDKISEKCKTFNYLKNQFDTEFCQNYIFSDTFYNVVNHANYQYINNNFLSNPSLKKIPNTNIFRQSLTINLSLNNSLEIAKDLEDEIKTQLVNLSSDEIDEVLKNLGERENSLFTNEGFWSKLQKLINGKESYNFVDIISVIASLFLDNLSGIIPILALICAVAIVSSLLLKLRGKALNKPLGDIIHFCTFAVIVVAVLSAVLQLVKLTSTTLDMLKKQMEICFPILLTLMASLGAGSSVAIYQPLIAILCGAIMQLFTSVLLPIFSLCIIFGVIGNLTSSVKLTKFTKFLESSFKYIIGFAFTIFSGFIAISGIVAGSYDGISIRATKFAVKSYIPIVGGYLSDGFSIIMASSVLIKNAIGYSGLIIMFLTIISPVLKIILFKLGLSLVAGIIESVADDRVTNFISNTAKSLSMLTSIILAFSFAYLICVGLIMCSANLV